MSIKNASIELILSISFIRGKRSSGSALDNPTP